MFDRSKVLYFVCNASLNFCTAEPRKSKFASISHRCKVSKTENIFFMYCILDLSRLKFQSGFHNFDQCSRINIWHICCYGESFDQKANGTKDFWL